MPRRLQQFLHAFAMASVLLLSLCVFTPFTLYTGNPTEFSAAFAAIVRVYLPVVSLMALALGAVGALLPHAAGRRYLAILAALSVLVWLQANLLVWQYGPLDGRSIDWLSGAWRGAIDIAVWLAVLAAAFIYAARVGRLMMTAAVVTLVIQIIPALLAWPTSTRHEQPDVMAGSSESLTAFRRFSAQKNVLHIVMDGFQSDIFADIINDPQNSGLLEQLDGFTFFRDNMGLYPYTQMSVPALLGGRIYRNEVPAQQFVDETLSGDTIFSAAAAAGMRVEVAAPTALRNVYARAAPDTALEINAALHASPREFAQQDAARLMDLSLFRSVPHFAKALVHRDELWVFQAGIRGTDYLHMQYFADLAFLDELADGMSIADKAPTYKLLHVMLAHRPTVGTADCRYAGVSATTRSTVRAQASCGLRKVLHVLARMQDLGIYDDSVIVLMADHGAWVPIEGFPDTAGPGAVAAGMAIPLLAVKPAGAQGKLRVSGVAASIADLPATLAGLLGLDRTFPGEHLFGEHFPAPRQRSHFTYAYGNNPRHEGFLFPMQEFIVTGSPFDPAAWQQGKLFAPTPDQ